MGVGVGVGVGEGEGEGGGDSGADLGMIKPSRNSIHFSVSLEYCSIQHIQKKIEKNKIFFEVFFSILSSLFSSLFFLFFFSSHPPSLVAIST